MSAITPEVLFKLEDNMQAITENEMARVILEENLWWKKLMRVRPSSNRRETLAWLLSTAKIHDAGKGGNIQFDDMVSQFVQWEHERFTAGLELTVDELSDNDGKGFDFAAEWAQQVGALSVYFPQEKAADLLLNGEVTTGPGGAAYDAKAFFATDHPLNPFKTGAGAYANLMTGASSGVYPGAVPIDESVTLDTARANVQKVVSYISSIKMPNGKTPRRLKVVGLMGPSTLAKRLGEITDAKFIAANASVSGAGGSQDASFLVRKWAFGEPIDAPELMTQGNGTTDLTSWYVITQQVTSTTLGALLFSERFPFKTTYYTGEGGGNGVDAILDRAQTLEWHLKGRNASVYGHPYGLFKCKAA